MCLDCGRGRLDGQKNAAMGLCTYAEVPCCAGTTGRPMKATDPSEGGSKATFQLKPLENFNENEAIYVAHDPGSGIFECRRHSEVNFLRPLAH